MLSYLCGDDGVTAGDLINLFHHIGTGQSIFIISERILFLHLLYMLHPLGMGLLFEPVIQDFKDAADVADDRRVGEDIFVDLRWIHSMPV